MTTLSEGDIHVTTYNRVWYGAVLKPSAYGACRGFAPALAVWVSSGGDLLSALATTSGRDGAVLEQALRIALRRPSATRPHCLAVVNECAERRLAATTAIRIRQGEYPGLVSVVRGHLAELGLPLLLEPAEREDPSKRRARANSAAELT